MIIIYVLLGLTATSFITEFFCILPGGLIVPVFLTTYIYQPEAIIGTLVIASGSCLLFFIVNHFFLIQKKRRFVLIIMFSATLVFVWRKFFPYFFPNDILFETVGWIIPGILSFNMAKKGFFKTIFFTMIIFLCLLPIYFLFKLLLSV